jgi:hypothetical protein
MKPNLLSFILLFSFLGYTRAQTALPTSWNFSAPPISSPPAGWTLGLGTNGNLTYSGASNSVGGDGVSARLDANGEFVKIWFSDAPGAVSYYMKGTGIAPAPAFQGQFKIQQSADDVTYTDLRSFTTANPLTGTITKYVDNPVAATRYIRFFYTEKLAGSNIALDSILIKAAPAGQSASIVIRRNGAVVVNGTTSVVGNSASVSFLVQNAGTVQALSIDSIRFEGPAAADFSAPGAPASIAAGSSQSLNVNFSPSASGSRICTMKVYNNDPAKNPYSIRLYGIGGTLASEPLQAPGPISFSLVNSFSFRMGFSNPAQRPERYLVLMKRNSPVTEVPTDGLSYQKGERIGGAQVAYAGDSALSALRPNYILANSTYFFKVFSFNGPSGYENYLSSAASENSVVTPGKQPGNYYSGIDPLQPTFVTDLRNKINPHDTVYYSLYAARMVSNWLARDTTGGQQVVNCVYTNIPYLYQGAFGWWSGTAGNPGTLTREHTFAQSWMPSSNVPTWPRNAAGLEFPEYSDLHHLFPAHQQDGNNRRSNNPFGNVVNVTFVAPTGLGKVGNNGSGLTVYEPKPEHKGDAARALMYMSTCYHLIGGLNWSFPSDQSPAVILQWHQQDPPSDHEIARHELIYSQQNNRNPFIDFPEWAERINFSNMAYITSNEKPEFRNQIYTHPNPVVDRLFVDATLIFGPDTRYDFTDISGKSVSEGSLSDAQSFIVMPSKPGIYHIKISNSKGQFVTRLVRQ